MLQRIRSKQRRIVQYTLYAWGLPAFITMLSFIVNISPGSTFRSPQAAFSHHPALLCIQHFFRAAEPSEA